MSNFCCSFFCGGYEAATSFTELTHLKNAQQPENNAPATAPDPSFCEKLTCKQICGGMVTSVGTGGDVAVAVLASEHIIGSTLAGALFSFSTVVLFGGIYCMMDN